MRVPKCPGPLFIPNTGRLQPPCQLWILNEAGSFTTLKPCCSSPASSAQQCAHMVLLARSLESKTVPARIMPHWDIRETAAAHARATHQAGVPNATSLPRQAEPLDLDFWVCHPDAAAAHSRTPVVSEVYEPGKAGQASCWCPSLSPPNCQLPQLATCLPAPTLSGSCPHVLQVLLAYGRLPQLHQSDEASIQ